MKRGATLADVDYGGAEQRCAASNARRPRVLRGGLWYFKPGWLRAANRRWYAPGTRTDTMGFRLARTFPF